MTTKTTYIKPQIKLYPVNTTEILAGSNTKSMSVGGDDTSVQLSKESTPSFDISE